MSESPAARRGSAPNKSIRRKSAARFSAIRALYAQHFESQKNSLTIDAWVDVILAQEQQSIEADDEEVALTDAPERAMLVSLLESERQHHAAIATYIRESMGEKWAPERMGPLLEAILHIAVAELLAKPDRSAIIIINEYIGLTQAYFEDNEVGFINGILATIARKIRGNDIDDRAEPDAHG